MVNGKCVQVIGACGCRPFEARSGASYACNRLPPSGPQSHAAPPPPTRAVCH